MLCGWLMGTDLLKELAEYSTLMRVPGCLILIRTELSLRMIDELQDKLNIHRDELIEQIIENELKGN